MTNSLFSLFLFLFPSHSGGTGSMIFLPDTPAADLVVNHYPYAVAKDHTLGPNAPTELVRCDPNSERKCWSVGWVRVAGVEKPTVCHDAHRTAIAGTWFVVQDQQGKCYTFDTTSQEKSSSEWTDLAGVNDHLANAGAPPVTDADFRTFEEWADERSRQYVTWSLVGLAITLGPLAGAVLAAVVWRREG